MNPLKQCKEKLHTLVLTNEERGDIRHALSRHMLVYKPRPAFLVASPYLFGVWQKKLAVGLAGFLIFILSGSTGLAFASSSALPGDTLYTLKVTKEELQAVTKVSSEARAVFEVERAEKRMEEAIILAQKGKLHKKNQERIAVNLQRHTEKITLETTKFAEEKPIEALEVATRLAISLEARGQILSEIAPKEVLAEEPQSITNFVAAIDRKQKEIQTTKESVQENIVAQKETRITKEQLDTKIARIYELLLVEKQARELPATTRASEELIEHEVSLAITATPLERTDADTVTITADTENTTPEEELVKKALVLQAEDKKLEAFLLLQKLEETLLRRKIKNEQEIQSTLKTSLEEQSHSVSKTPTTEIKEVSIEQPTERRI